MKFRNFNITQNNTSEKAICKVNVGELLKAIILFLLRAYHHWELDNGIEKIILPGFGANEP